MMKPANFSHWEYEQTVFDDKTETLNATSRRAWELVTIYGGSHGDATRIAVWRRAVYDHGDTR
jgi:hypothetical protein